MRTIILVVLLGTAAACGSGGSGSGGSGTCGTGEVACGGACCPSGQACDASSRCVAGYQVTIHAEGIQGATGTLTGAGMTCGSDAWQGCTAVLPAGQTVSFTAAPGAGAAFAGFTGVDAASGSTGTITVNAARALHAWFGMAGGSPSCPTLQTTACTHGTFVAQSITRPLTLNAGRLVDADKLPCSFVGGWAATTGNVMCGDAYVCGVGPYAIEVTMVDTLWGTAPGWSLTSPSVNWSSNVLCDGVCTHSSQCGAGQVCTSGQCVSGGGGGPDPCAQCLDACRGLPGCCTGEGCICQSAC